TRDLDPIRAGEQQVLAATAGQHAPSWGNLAVLALKRPEAFVAVVAWINIDDHQPVGGDAEIGVRRTGSEPMFDDAGLGRGTKHAVRGKLAVRMLGGIAAARSAATISPTRTNKSATVFNRPLHREDRMAMARKGKRGQEGLGHALPSTSVPWKKCLVMS